MTTAKNYSSTYLYNKGEYERHIVKYLIGSKEIDKEADYFKDIIYEVKKRQQTSQLVNVLMSNRVVLLHNLQSGTARSFRVFTAGDIRNGDKKTLKTYIDVTDIFIEDAPGVYHCDKIDNLVAYLISAMNQVIYYKRPDKIVNNSSIISSGTGAFVSLINYVFGYLKVSGFFGPSKEKILYLAGIYFQTNLLSKDMTDSVKNYARKASKISMKDAEIVDILWKEEDMENIDAFIKMIARITKSKELTTEVFIDKWIYLFGTSTTFATELYIAFATMMSDCYCASFINNYKTIEKATGNDMLDFTNALFKVGSEPF